MPAQFHGIGTVYYGQRDYWPDGSYVTTEWAVLAWIPMFPTFSKRISVTQNNPYATRDGSGYYVYETTAPNLKQVFCVYAWFASILFTVFTFESFKDIVAKLLGDEDRAAAVWFLALIIEGTMPYLLRRWARRRKILEWRRASVGLGPPPLT